MASRVWILFPACEPLIESRLIGNAPGLEDLARLLLSWGK